MNKLKKKNKKFEKNKKKHVKKVVHKHVAKKSQTPSKKFVPKKVQQERVRYKRAEPPSVETIFKILEKGKQRGYITENEVLFTFTEVEDYVEFFEEFLENF